VTPTAVQLRRYAETDRVAIDGLVDADSDPLWVAQGHTLHGPHLDDGPRWRRTVVAEVDGRVVGAATVGSNRVHTGECNLAVEVAAAHRRRGIATALVENVRTLRREPVPMASKLRPDDAAGIALLRHFGGRPYQTCPGLRPDPCAADITAWCEAASVPAGVAVRPLSDLAAEHRRRLWVEQYLWVHERWAPADRAGLESLAAQLADAANPSTSFMAVRAREVDAIAWAFDEDDGSVGIVAETARRDTADGAALVAATLARCLLRLRDDGCRAAEIDGHDADPHLAPVLETFPPCPSAPLWLVTID
jgi:GNAT superfamily N-acetyltransferase